VASAGAARQAARDAGKTGPVQPRSPALDP